jgi:succinate dehydrogenase / fumarate reductase cytochrome b subunit
MTVGKQERHTINAGKSGVKMKDRRPVFFNLTQIQIPVGSLTSITHRVTGILLALGMPFGIHLLQRSLQDSRGYAEVVSLFDKPAFKVMALFFIWALTHHLLAGLRHLLSDIDVGSHLPAARVSAWIVNCSAVFIALLSLGALF